MDRHCRHPSLSLITSVSAAEPVTSSSTLSTPSRSPFRYLHFAEPSQLDEKDTPLAVLSSTSTARSLSADHHFRFAQSRSSSSLPSSSTRQPSPSLKAVLIPSLYSRLQPWIPIALWVLTSLAFLLAIALFRSQLFTALDDLSHWLREYPERGYSVLFCLIFITTIPPFPLYSTLIVLSGYTFGPWTGAMVSYAAALTGALVVFVISRTLFRTSIARWLDSTRAMKRVVMAIERRPKLLFLIRLAPYPYNVMNCLLAAAPTLTLKTYTICTALSLFKVIIHTSLGASIHSFKEYHTTRPGNSPDSDDSSDTPVVTRIWTVAGILLCVAIIIYLTYVARKAVDEELHDSYEVLSDGEERIAFLNRSDDLEAASNSGPHMLQSPLNTHHILSARPSNSSH